MRPRSGSVSSSISNCPADLSESSRTDRLADTVSYSNVVATATAAFKNANYKLLERAAGAVADAILAAFPRISAVKITVHKPHAPIAAIFEDVGVVLTRSAARAARMADVLIALGGNVGDVRATFRKAIANICGMTQAALLARSSDYATPPWGDEQQARFINACIEIETALDPHALLFTLHKIEHKFGRDRTKETRWGPRTLDLDLIAYDDVSIQKPGPDAAAPAACSSAPSCWCRSPRLCPTVSLRDAASGRRWRSYRPRELSGCRTSD